MRISDWSSDVCCSDLLLAERGVTSVSGITLDIGVSSMQLDRPERGFSFQADGPLAMTMSQDGMSAADFLNNDLEQDIADVLYRFGEITRSRRVDRKSVVRGERLTVRVDLGWSE